MVTDEALPGMLMSFAVCDATAARAELSSSMRELSRELAGAAPQFGMLMSCAGRGMGLYGERDVDTRIVRERFPNVPFAGMFSTFEIGPLGLRPAMHLYTGRGRHVRLSELSRHRAIGPARSFRSAFALSKLGGADAGLAIVVVVVVAMMVVPLPTWLLDILLATNLRLSVAILLVVLYVPDALSIATFPTLLLITTLFRLALNVSSTRLILLQANAGEVIDAFGQFVVRGNYVVGAVVFLILTIIQFIVIAKGSERVAEVGARFVLDAMPGKQMAIDAELRSGAIDGNEARRRRRQLARESQFYGAMDGAMKFVKGDVIASVIITFINILGGLAIGVGQRGHARSRWR